ncbi:disease resistance protein adr1, partial [Quercus suber]
ARRIKTFLLPCQPWYCTSNLDSSTYSAIVASLNLRLARCSLKQSLERMMINNKTCSGNLPSIASSSSSSTIVAPLSKLSYMRIEEALPEECLPNLISLRTLYLINCPLPQGIRYLTALQHLLVGNSKVVDLFNDWDEMEWQGLTTLLSLEFFALPKLVSLPMGLQYVSSLQKLNISICDSLIAIPEWICKLISLQSLEIRECPNLESLPEGIGALTSLQTLEIFDFPKLESLPEGIDEEEPNEEAKKPACQNWDLIKAFGCCNYSTTQQLTHWAEVGFQGEGKTVHVND